MHIGSRRDRIAERMRARSRVKMADYNIEGVSFRRVFLIRRHRGAQAVLKCRHVINVFGRRVEIIQINILHVRVESGDFDGEAEIQQLVRC